MKSFRNLLAKKISIQPSKNFEPSFWEKFDSEFAGNRTSPFRWFERFEFQFVSGTFAAAALVLVLVRFSPTDSVHSPTYEFADLSQDSQIEMIAQADLLQDYELINELEEIPTKEGEWKILIGENT